MPQREIVPSHWEHVGALDDEPIVRLQSNVQGRPFDFTFELIGENVFRTTLSSTTHPLPPHPSVVVSPSRQDSFRADIKSGRNATSREIRAGQIVANIDWSESSPVVRVSYADSKEPLHVDVPHRSYSIDGHGVAHYSRYNRGTLYVGLGEKAAPMNFAGRRFELSATDSFGYDVYRTDPLYKHIPLLLNATPHGCVGLFSTSHSRGTYSIGAEMDGMWGHYKVYRQDYGGLEELVIVGKTLKDVVCSYAKLAGFPLLVPRWAFGYLAGGMKYSMLDDPPASEALLELARKMKEHDIPCSAYQMSSGYTVAEAEPKTRNVFTWNRHRFSDPVDWIQKYHKLGMRLIANVKPYILASHPEYEKLKQAGALFTDPNTKTTAVTRLWSAGGGESDEGGHIDFTSAAGFKWWYEGIKRLRQEGLDCMWNDNNEYTIADDDWQCALDEPSLQVPENINGRRDVGLWGRSMHTELHGKASYDALLATDPDSRPFVLTRGATAGTMRYACSTWSGDNTTSWAGMKGANALSLNAGVSLLQCYGHDIGGFEGPQPSPELLLRWVQVGIYSSRFAINCFKTGDDNNVGDVIEPWMYPSITHLIRKAIKRRYAMIPYLYSLSLISHQMAVPPQRWTGWGYESDPRVWSEKIMDGEDQYWLGDSLLIGGVYEPGVTRARMYLPRHSIADQGFLNVNPPYQYFEAGQWVNLDAEWHGSGIPVLAKIGTAVPIGRDVQVLSPGEKENVADLPLDDYRAVEIFPHPSTPSEDWSMVHWFEDDGVAVADKTRISKYTISYRTTESNVVVRFSRDESSGFVAPWKALSVILPVGDLRDVVANGGAKIRRLQLNGNGRRHFELRWQDEP